MRWWLRFNPCLWIRSDWPLTTGSSSIKLRIQGIYRTFRSQLLEVQENSWSAPKTILSVCMYVWVCVNVWGELFSLREGIMMRSSRTPFLEPSLDKYCENTLGCMRENQRGSTESSDHLVCIRKISALFPTEHQGVDRNNRNHRWVLALGRVVACFHPSKSPQRQ